ncbi:aquaporin AQPAn.G-like [Culicoides brevitarsis]|uniref:aquaporin AQPAn.G-like n=1 Tax=Culicoides brevitarsis TaxID=469753 RepID=UPI00307B5585
MVILMKSSIQDAISVFLAELLGTGMITFAGCMSCVPWKETPSNFEVAIAFGLVIMMIILIFGSVSGAHLNPAVTVAACIFKSITFKMSLLYILAQFLGGFLGYGLLKLATPEPIFVSNICVTSPAPEISLFQALLIEFCMTTILLLVCCGVWDPRSAKNTDSIPLKFGFTVAALSIIGGPYTGCSMNPARTLGPAIWNQDLSTFWIYLSAPMTAAIVIPIIYKVIFYRELPSQKSGEASMSA